MWKLRLFHIAGLPIWSEIYMGSVTQSLQWLLTPSTWELATLKVYRSPKLAVNNISFEEEEHIHIQEDLGQMILYVKLYNQKVPVGNYLLWSSSISSSPSISIIPDPTSCISSISGSAPSRSLFEARSMVIIEMWWCYFKIKNSFGECSFVLGSCLVGRSSPYSAAAGNRLQIFLRSRLRTWKRVTCVPVFRKPG